MLLAFTWENILLPLLNEGTDHSMLSSVCKLFYKICNNYITKIITQPERETIHSMFVKYESFFLSSAGENTLSYFLETKSWIGRLNELSNGDKDMEIELLDGIFSV